MTDEAENLVDDLMDGEEFEDVQKDAEPTEEQETPEEPTEETQETPEETPEPQVTPAVETQETPEDSGEPERLVPLSALQKMREKYKVERDKNKEAEPEPVKELELAPDEIPNRAEAEQIVRQETNAEMQKMRLEMAESQMRQRYSAETAGNLTYDNVLQAGQQFLTDEDRKLIAYAGTEGLDQAADALYQLCIERCPFLELPTQEKPTEATPTKTISVEEPKKEPPQLQEALSVADQVFEFLTTEQVEDDED